MQLDLEKGMMDCLYAKCKHVTLLSCIRIIFLVTWAILVSLWHLIDRYAFGNKFWCLVMKAPHVSRTVLWLSLKNWDRSIVWPWGVLSSVAILCCLMHFLALSASLPKKGFNLVFALYPYSSSSTHAKSGFYLVLQVVFSFVCITWFTFVQNCQGP